MGNISPIGTTNGALIYITHNGYFVRPPNEIIEYYEDRLATNKCLWASTLNTVKKYLKDFRKVKYGGE